MTYHLHTRLLKRITYFLLKQFKFYFIFVQ